MLSVWPDMFWLGGFYGQHMHSIVRIRTQTLHIFPRDTQTVAMAMEIPLFSTVIFPLRRGPEDPRDVERLRHVPVHIPEVTLETAEYLHVAGHCGPDVVMQKFDVFREYP